MNARMAITYVGAIAGEMKDAADMRYDDPSHQEIHDRLDNWAKDLLIAWEVLKLDQESQKQ